MLKYLIYLFYKFIAKKNSLLVQDKFFGLYFKINPKDIDGTGGFIYRQGEYYETDETRFLLDHIELQPNEIILDIGANIGWYSLLFAKKFPKNKIFAFEPEPKNYDFLLENIQLNKLENIVPIKKAISDNEATINLYKFNETNLGRHSALPINTNEIITVDATTIDNFVISNQIDPANIKLLKIDIEGYELQALKGATQTLNSIPYIMCEYSPEYMKKGGIDPEELLQLLSNYNYKPYLFSHHKKVATNLKELLRIRHRVINTWWEK